MVPEVGIEPTRAQGPLDFESSASTSFTTPAWIQLVTLIALLSQEQSNLFDTNHTLPLERQNGSQ